jgi:O-antigen ligase
MTYLLIGYMWLFVHRPFEVWPVLGTYHIERVYIGACVVYWLLYRDKTWTANRLNVALSMFLAAFLLSWLDSPFRESVRCSKAVEDYLKVAVFCLLVLGSVRDERQLKCLTLGYLVAVGLYMTHSLREFYNGRHIYRMGIPRMIGVDETLNDPNAFAATLLYSLPLAQAFWPEVSNRRQRALLSYYTGLTITCIVLTGSRSGFVGLICYGLLVSPILMRKKALLLSLVVLMPVGWLVIPAHLQNRFWTVIDPSVGPKNAQASADGRTKGLYDGIALWQRRPLLGFGPGAHGLALGHGFQPHSLYGQVLGETGTVGTLAWLGIVAGFVWNELEMRRLRQRDEFSGSSFPANLSAAILISVVLLLIKGYADHNLYRYTWVWFAVFQAIALRCVREDEGRGWVDGQVSPGYAE